MAQTAAAGLRAVPAIFRQLFNCAQNSIAAFLPLAGDKKSDAGVSLPVSRQARGIPRLFATILPGNVILDPSGTANVAFGRRGPVK
jgi:hypothetical protein